MYSTRILKDSRAPCGKRLTTWELTYPRFVHAELMTHRLFCLAGDAVLEFDMPAGQAGGARRVHKLTIADFVAKWIHGSAPHRDRWGGMRTYDLKSRLREMRIRQLDEATGDIITSTITDAFESGTKPVYEITAGKYKIAGSSDHRVMTDDGWKTIGELRVGDVIAVSTRKKPEDLKTDPLRLKLIDGSWRSVWQRQQRDRLVEENPKCRRCLRASGDAIHHLVPVYQDTARAFDETNITLLCDACHAAQHETQGWQTGVPLYSGLAVIDGIRYRGVEPTYDLTIAGPFPNFLANRVVVHNSRNSASSRAIPTEKLLARVREDPALPKFWGRNQSGMQAAEQLDGAPQKEAQKLWLAARDQMLEAVEQLGRLGLHKQLANRLIEPWMFITVIVSATEFDNWFHLRNHKAAQPEIAWVAKDMWRQFNEGLPKQLGPSEWHLPLFDEASELVLVGHDISMAKKVSTGRCARVSYLTHEGRRDVEKDVELHDRLCAGPATGEPGHWSPFEHVARAMERPDRVGNYIGWFQYRKEFEAEHFGGRLP